MQLLSEISDIIDPKHNKRITKVHKKIINEIFIIEIFIQGVNRCKNILDNLSNKPDFKGFRRKLVTKTF